MAYETHLYAFLTNSIGDGTHPKSGRLSAPRHRNPIRLHSYLQPEIGRNCHTEKLVLVTLRHKRLCNHKRNVNAQRSQPTSKKKLRTLRGQKKHINIFNVNFLAPTQNTRFLPPEKSPCASFPGKGPKRDPHKLSGGMFGSKRSQTGHFRPQKVSFIVFFGALIRGQAPTANHHRETVQSDERGGGGWLREHGTICP